MLYLLARYLVHERMRWLEGHGLGSVRVFQYVSFRAAMAVVASFLTCVLLGPRVIAWLRMRKIGDLAGFDQVEIDELMAGKKGTPTMGGLLIVGAIAASTLLLGDLSNFYVTMALICLLWMAGVGAADDWLKLTAGRRAGTGRVWRARRSWRFR